MRVNYATNVIENLNPEKIALYTNYWNAVTPADSLSELKAGVFAILSVHTTWQSNVAAFKHLTSQLDLFKADTTQIQKAVKEGKVGLYKIRTKGISDLQNWFNSGEARKHILESVEAETGFFLRNAIHSKICGLGPAKSSFFTELLFPTDPNLNVTCLDTHMLQLYDMPKSGLSWSEYREAERHWVTTCRENGIPPFIARQIYWDEKQNQSSPRYWSSCFECADTIDPEIIAQFEGATLETDSDG